MSDKVRIDRWLWSVRLFKTRSAAQTACTQGRVDVDGDTAKPARRISPGERVTIRLKDRIRIVEVVQPLEKRVGAALAAEAYIDHSPPAPERRPDPFVATAPERDRGAGRPTKRERRELDRFRRGRG